MLAERIKKSVTEEVAGQPTSDSSDHERIAPKEDPSFGRHLNEPPQPEASAEARANQKSLDPIIH
jgi:hypothetical protein